MIESFAILLKRHRVAAGLSQETLAERAGVSVDAISYLERDSRHAPQKATLDLLIAALALEADAQQEIEEAAKLARARGPRSQRRGAFLDSTDEALPNNLPPQLTSFVDREQEVEEIKELLQSYRLVTVVGTGGVGKSRCTIRVAEEMLEGFGDGVWLAELAAISDSELVTSVVARTLAVQETPHRPMLDTLLAYLKRKRLLLILDNCEHVIDEARRVAAAILRGCHDIRILATSRESLNIAGEQVFRLPSLPVPSISELLSANEMSKYGAVQLFSDRSVSANNRFTLTVESAPHVADICRRLDGIPLAIELAAARIKVLSPHELAQKLNERFRLLTAGDRSALPRHHTMRALIDWSYDLLSEDERSLFRKLSIFAGGFTLETAAAVFEDGETDEIVVLDLLSSLVDKSLAQAEVAGGDTRYRLLESTRQYARERLRDAGEEDAVARAHAGTFVMLAERLDDAYDTTPDRVWFAQVEPELENFRAALSWAFGPRGEALLGQRMAGTLFPAWNLFAAGAEGQRWVQAAQQRITSDTPDTVVAALDLAEALYARTFSQFKASLAAAERALARYRELSDPRRLALAEAQIGRAQLSLGEIAQGEALLAQALHAAQSQGPRRASFLHDLAVARQLAGDVPGARQRFNEAMADARAVGAERPAAHIALGLAEVEFSVGDPAAALLLVDEAAAAFHAFGEIRPIATARVNRAAYLVALRRHDEARTAARDAVTDSRDMHWAVGLAFALQHLAAVAALRPNADEPAIEEDRRRAALILGYVDADLAALEAQREYTERQEYDVVLPLLGDALGEDQLARLMNEGATWSEDQAVAEAMLI